MTAPEVIRAGLLEGIAHGFLGRRGGVSRGVHAELNVGVGSDDDAHSVRQNRDRARDAVLPGSALVTLYQVHSPTVVIVDAPFPGERPLGDALVTCTAGLLLGILTADCAPVLLADREAGVVAAAHAGWKGAIGGVTDATIETMETIGARRDRIVAAIGPCIARASYEVDRGFIDRFLNADPSNERFFTEARRSDHAQFDLEGYVAARLAAADIGRVEMLGLDTYADADRFFSYRRATHRAESDYGRQISLIGISA